MPTPSTLIRVLEVPCSIGTSLEERGRVTSLRSMADAKPAVVFVDRDGVINRMLPDYVKSWDEFEILPGALGAMARLSAAGVDIVVLTNQSAIGRGLVSQGVVDEKQQRLRGLVR